MNNKEQLVLESARAFYLNQGEIKLSDREYDDYMKELGWTNHDIYDKLDLTKNTGHGIQLVQPELPKSKVNDYEHIYPMDPVWINTPKYDGSSIEIVYENGKLKAILSSSGILQTKKLANKVPHVVDSRITRVYCEAVVDINIYGDTARQYANGLINSVHKQDEVDSNLYLIAFNCEVSNESKYFDKMKVLRSNIQDSLSHFMVTDLFDIDKVESNSFVKYKLRDILVYIDGVVSYHKEDSNKNYINKLYLNEKKTSFVNKIEVVYQSGTDLYAPKLHIEPVVIDGNNVTKISASAKKIRDNQLGRMAEIEVFRSGQTIPKNGKTIVGSDDFQDLKCKCGTKLDFELTIGNNFKCPNEECEVRDTWTENIYDAYGIDTVINFYRLFRFTGFKIERIKDTFSVDKAITIGKHDPGMLASYIREQTKLTGSQDKVLDLNCKSIHRLLKSKF